MPAVSTRAPLGNNPKTLDLPRGRASNPYCQGM